MHITGSPGRNSRSAPKFPAGLLPKLTVASTPSRVPPPSMKGAVPSEVNSRQSTPLSR